jgi:hypothetical protein
MPDETDMPAKFQLLQIHASVFTKLEKQLFTQGGKARYILH